MKSAGRISLGTAVMASTVCLGLVTVFAAQQPATKTPAAPTAPKPATVAATKPAVSHPATAPAPAAASAADYNGLVKKYCVGCHNDRNKDRTASLTLTSFDFAKIGEHADTGERMIRKLQASMMPPPGMPRPEPAEYARFIKALETSIDAHAKANPNPG